MIPLIVAVFIASLMGSLHCAGMCGAFVAFAVTGGIEEALGVRRPLARLPLHLAYHGGRLLTYTALGALAGAAGAAFDLAGELAGASRAAAVGAGGMMALFGTAGVLRALGVRWRRAPVPRWVQRLLARGHASAARRTPVVRALLTGLLTTLLPCGWLYAFVITSAGTADPVAGAATMAAFWLGTVPMLAAVGAGVERLAGVLGARLPLVTAGVIVAVGLLTVFHREALTLDVNALRASILGPGGGGGDSSVDRVAHLNSSELPCCHAPRK